MWVRYVLVPGWTDNDEHVDGLADFLAGLCVVERVDVLPFHKLGGRQVPGAGHPLPVGGHADAPPAELVESVRNRFRARGLRAD
ncbi:hypothetical protein GCM10020000_04680 [Streptomyces olivoverticillatus]